MLKQLFATKPFTMCHGKSISFFSTIADIHNILSTHLKTDCDSIKKLSSIKGDYIIANIPKNQIIRNCTILVDTNVNLEKIEFLPKCLMLKPMIMRNRIFILKEMGVKCIALDHIYRFPSSMRKSIRFFKKEHNIPVKENIMDTIFSNIGILKNNTDINLKKFSYTTRTSEYFKVCMLYYKTYYLKLNDKSFYTNKRLKYQSLTEISKLITVLKNECKLDEEAILKHPYLLNLDIDNVTEILTEFKNLKISGKTIIEIIRKRPRILFYEKNKINEILHFFQVLNIPTKSIISCVQILNMHKGRFLQRYMDIANTEELSLWLRHPRIVSMIYNYNMVLNRVEYLKSVNYLKAANINTLLSRKTFFHKFMGGEILHKTARKYLLYVLSKELGNDKCYLIKAIERHPYWKHIELFNIVKTIHYLKKHYTIEDICSNIHIILYPINKVIDTLNLVHEEHSPQKGYDFNASQYLALCMYKLEKEYHFSGDGVWQAIHNEMYLDQHLFKDVEENEVINLLKNEKMKEDGMLDLTSVAWFEHMLQSSQK